MLQTLGMLEPFNLRQTGHNTVPTLHVMLEANRLAYADRAAYMGDADFAAVPTFGLLSPQYVATRRALIDPDHVNPNPTAGDPWEFEPGQARADQSGPARQLDDTTADVLRTMTAGSRRNDGAVHSRSKGVVMASRPRTSSSSTAMGTS